MGLVPIISNGFLVFVYFVSRIHLSLPSSQIFSIWSWLWSWNYVVSGHLLKSFISFHSFSRWTIVSFETIAA